MYNINQQLVVFNKISQNNIRQNLYIEGYK